MKRSALVSTLFLALAALLGAGLAGTARAQSAPLYGLPYLAAFDRLPVFKDTVCRQVSSYDRTGGNGDLGHFLNGDHPNVPEGRAVLADLKGPGCIYRIWSANAAGFLRVYFDGEAEPRIACPMQDLFLGRYPPFQKPLADHVSGGWYSYFPLPFARSCRIEVENPGSMYYQVQYQQLPEGTAVRTFTRELTPEDREALERVLEQWRNPGRQPVRFLDPLGEAKGEARPLGPGRKATLLRAEGGGVVRSLRVRVERPDRFALRALVIRAWWDGASVPSVEAPLGDFFGAAFGDQRFRSLPLGMTNDGYYCYFPMPFSRGARIEIENEGREGIPLSWEVVTAPGENAPERAGRFHARWRRVTTEEGKHVTLLDTTGRGHFVGVNVNMQGHRGLWFLEGDEKIYVDGETFPSIYGTGLEDYFTAGWYYETGPFALPLHGCVVKDDPGSRISTYRYQVPDCVPFRKSLRVDIEHGGTNDYPGADYTFTTYWYQDGSPSDWARLPDLRARRPASIRAQAVLEAEGLRAAAAREVSDEGLPLELSGGGALQGTGERPLALELEVPADAHYSVAAGFLTGPEGGMLQASVDGRPLPQTVDTYSPEPSVRRVELGLTGPLTKGTHRLMLHALGRNLLSRGERLVVDYVALRKQIHPGALEGERLRILEATPGVPLDPQDMRVFGMNWSGDSHLWFRPSAPGAFFTVELPVAQAGRYRLSL